MEQPTLAPSALYSRHLATATPRQAQSFLLAALSGIKSTPQVRFA